MQTHFWQLALCTFLVGPTLSLADDKSDEQIRRATVRVLATQRPPHYLRPWLRQPGQQSAGSGVVIEGQRILTNAHVVAYAAQVYVQPYQSSQTFPATVEGIGLGVDLAVLKVENPAFFKDRAAIPLAKDLPEVNAAVTLCGYVIGGSSLSTTKATVSRIEFGAGLTGDDSLRIELGGAVNPGNSGGAAVVNHEMIGLVLGFLPQAQNVGYVIPNEEIDAFLAGVVTAPRPASGPAIFRGKSQLGMFAQRLENAALRNRLELDDASTGILVRRLFAPGPNCPLQEQDVVTHIGEHAIDNSGMVRIRENLSLAYDYLVPKLARNGMVPLTVLRQGNKLDLNVPVTVEFNTVIRSLHGESPPYFVYGPLVFSIASTELVQALTPYAASLWTVHASPLLYRQADLVQFDGEELVLVTAVLPHKLTQGYDDAAGHVVSQVNDVQIRNLRHLAETLRDAKDRFIEIKFADRYVEALVFERREVLAAMDELLADNGIRQPCSAGLRDVWKFDQ